MPEAAVPRTAVPRTAVRRVLFIPQRFSDYRMWGDIPARLAGRAKAIHLDQHLQLAWADSRTVVASVRGLLAPGGCDVAVAAGDTCPFAVELADAGLAGSLVLLDPEIPFDRIPDDVEVSFGAVPDDILAPYEPIVSALHDADPDEWRDLIVGLVRQTMAAGADPAELERAVSIAADHAAEVRAELQAFAAADAAERDLPDEVQLARFRTRGRWLDQLASLTLPVVTVVPAAARSRATTLSRLAPPQHEVVLTQARYVLLPGGRDGQAAAAIERMLDRAAGQPPPAEGQPPAGDS